MPREHPSLIARKPCGCISEAVVVYSETYKHVGELYKNAAKDNTVVTEIKPGDEMPDWECPEHKQKRLDRKKQASLFTE